MLIAQYNSAIQVAVPSLATFVVVSAVVSVSIVYKYLVVKLFV